VEIPAVAYAAAASQAVPVLAALRHGRALSVSRRWIIVWALLALAADTIGLWYALRGRNNHWLGYLYTPLGAGILILALSQWQDGALIRLVYRVAIPMFGLVWLLLVLLVENTGTFSLIAGPLNALVLLLAGIGVLVVRLQRAEGNLLQADWFWVGIGVALRYGSDVALHPFALFYGDQAPNLVYSALQVKAGLTIVASLAIAGGMLCPLARMRSGGSSSPASSPSGSW